jgi:hypothetical protein
MRSRGARGRGTAPDWRIFTERVCAEMIVELDSSKVRLCICLYKRRDLYTHEALFRHDRGAPTHRAAQRTHDGNDAVVE